MGLGLVVESTGSLQTAQETTFTEEPEREYLFTLAREKETNNAACPSLIFALIDFSKLENNSSPPPLFNMRGCATLKMRNKV